jgi:hypothetical protein
MALKRLLSLSPNKVVCLVHHPGSLPLPVRPCNQSNGSDTKTHWTLEELHRALSCHHFCNYKHILQTSLDGKWINGGEFPLLLGTYTTIPKAPHGSAINREQSFFLDIVHVNIAFGDCVLVGGFQYSLIFIDQATCYNWVFGRKDLSKESILSTF